MCICLMITQNIYNRATPALPDGYLFNLLSVANVKSREKHLIELVTLFPFNKSLDVFL